MSTTDQWVLNYANPTSDKQGFTFSVTDCPVSLVSCGLASGEAIGIEVLVGCGDDVCWSPASVNACPLSVSPLQNPSVITLPGTYRLTASADGAEFATPSDVKIYAQACPDNMFAPYTQVQQLPTDLDAIKGAVPIVVTPPTCDVITQTFAPGIYTEADLALSGSLYQIQFSAQNEDATGELAGSKGSGSIPFTGVDGEINSWCAPTINGEVCYLSGFTLTVTAGEVEVTATCVA